LFAAYLTNVPVDFTQPDGTEIECFVSGDEFYHWLHDADNYTIIRSPKTGYYVYAEQDGENVKAGSLVVGRDDDQRYRLSPGIKISEALYGQKRSIFSAPQNLRDPPTTGTFNNLVIFVRFSDQDEFDETISTYEGWFNTDTTSMQNYYLETSYNKLTVNSTFYPPAVGGNVVSYQDSFPRSYYEPYSTSNTDGFANGDERKSREDILILNAVTSIASSVPTGLNIDANDDGDVDNVVFVIRGGSSNDILWPHQWSVSTQTVTLNSKTVVKYNFQIETFQYTEDSSVLCHEFFHSLGAPDLYRYTNFEIVPVGPWDLMAFNANPPQHMNAHMKWKYGHWIPPIQTITLDQVYSLFPATDSVGLAYKIDSPYSLSEYFIVEYRRKTGTFETSLPGSGLLVWRINTNKEWGNAGGPPDEVYVYRPNGDLTTSGSINSAFFSLESSRTEMNDLTNPNSFLQDGSSGGLDILNIGSAGDSIIFTKSSAAGTTIEFPPDTYTEGFNEEDCPPEGWLTTSVNGSDEYQHVFLASNPPAMPYEGLKMLAYPSHTAPTGSSAIIATPRININDIVNYNYSISFRMYRDDGFLSTPDKVEVYFDNTASVTGDYILLGTIHRSIGLAPTESANGWYQYNFTMYPPEAGFYHIILKVFSAGGNNIYIDDFSLVRAAFPPSTSVWIGSSSSDWHLSTNWRNGYLPDSGQDVVILPDTPHQPLLESINGSCRDLQILNGASLQINNVTLSIYRNATINGELIMMLSTPKIICYGDLSFNTDAPITGSNPVIEVYGNCMINNSSTFYMDEGLLKLTGSTSTSFRCNTRYAVLDNLTIQKFSATVFLSMDSDSRLKLLGDFTIANGANFTAVTDTCNIEVYGNLTSYGDIKAYVGTIKFPGTASNLNLSSTSFLHDLNIYNSCTLTLMSDLKLLGNLIFSLGYLDATNRTINIGGNWKTISEDRFIGVGSTVIFDGYDDQDCYETNFNNLELNNGLGNLKIGLNQSVHANSFEFTSGTIEVDGGSFIVDDLADTNIKGGYILHSGIINLTQDSEHYTDLDADIEIHGGVMTIQGGIDFPIDWAYTRDITLEMDGGALVFADNGIGLTETGHTLNAWITGGIIRIGGSFVVDRMNFYPAGGTIELIGTADAVVSQHVASSIYNLMVNKGSRNGGIRSSDRSNNVTFTSNTIIDNNLIVNNGSLTIDSVYVFVGNNFNVSGSLAMTNANAILDITNTAVWGYGSSCNITAGAINIGGNLSWSSGIDLNIGTGNTISLVGSQNSTLSLYDDDASFGNLIIDKFPGVVSTGTSGNQLTVSGDMTITGESQVELNTTTCIIVNLLSVEGMLSCASSSIISAHDLYLSGILTVDDANVFIADDFTQETWGTLTIDSGSFSIDAPYTGALFGFAGIVNLYDGVLQITNEGIQFGPSSQYLQTGGILKVGWGFKAIYTNVFQPGAGSVEFIGARIATIECNNGNYFHDLTFNNPSISNSVYFMTDIQVNNDLIVQGGNPTLMNHTLTVNRDVLIEGGRLSAGNAGDIINVSRNWYNSYALTGFEEGNGTVNFVSGLDAFISMENFNLVNIIKTFQGPDMLRIMGGATVTVDSTLNIISGYLKLDGGCTLNVNDDININDYCGLDISSIVGVSANNLYLGGNLYDGSTFIDATHGFTAYPNSMIVLDGDSTQVLYGTYSSMTFNSVTVNKSSGKVMHSNDLDFMGTLEIISGDWSYAVPEKTKNFFGDLYIAPAGSFTDSTGTCIFSGNLDSALKILGIAKMPNISILKSVGISLYLNGNATFADITDISMLSGILNLQVYTLQLTGSLTLSEDCTLSMYNGSVLSLGDGSSVYLGYGTSFISYGLSGDPATITSFDGHYAFTVGADASVTVEYSVFEKMDFMGISIEPGAIVDSLHCFTGCTFLEGEAGGSLLSWNPSRDLIIHDAVFPANTWDGMYNVSRYNSLGSVYMMNASGDFAGALYEYDLNDNVFWENTAVPDAPQNLHITQALGEAILNWDAVTSATGYRIYRSFTTDVEITGVEVGDTASTTWSDENADINPAAFYMVKAYIEYRMRQR